MLSLPAPETEHDLTGQLYDFKQGNDGHTQIEAERPSKCRPNVGALNRKRQIKPLFSGIRRKYTIIFLNNSQTQNGGITQEAQML
jgi:hypothetical protein